MKNKICTLSGLAAALAITLTAILTPAAHAAFLNGGFEVGAATQPPSSWIVTSYTNLAGFTVQSPQTLAGLNLGAGGVPKTVTLSAASANSQSDITLGTGASFRWPRYGTGCAIVNQLGANRNINALSQTMTVGAGDVDPDDGQVHMRFVYAPVMQIDNHVYSLEGYCFIQLVNVTQGTVLFSDFYTPEDTGIPFKTVTVGANQYAYTDWQLVDVAPGSTRINIGDTVTLKLFASGCELGGHFGEMYVDGVGVAIPGVVVEGTAPVSVAGGSNLTYNLHYKNGASAARTGAQIYFTTPTNTTFQSVSLPVGATATTPPVGATGIVIVTLPSPLAAGASSNFNITVAVNAGVALGSTLVNRNYYILSNEEPSLIGPPVSVQIVAAAPVVTTLTASSITTTNATLNGTVNPGNSATTAYFQYGTTNNYGSFSATNTLAATTVTLSVSNLISGLSPATLYHYRLVGINSVGTNFGGDMTFTTSAAQPVNFSLFGAGKVIGGAFQFGFSNVSGAGFTVLGTTNVAWPINAWSNLGPVVETPSASGHYQFTDPQATNSVLRFYRVRSP